MRASIVIAAHNEGENLWKTVKSCVETTRGFRCEIVIADDASTDGSVKEARRRFPKIRVVRHRTRRGCSPAKDLGARKSRGKVIVFLDGHCKPQLNAIRRLVEDVEALRGEAIVTPMVPTLDDSTWTNNMRHAGFGFRLTLHDLDCEWINVEAMRPYRRFYESPALVGCCAAVSRKLYEKLWGFDRHMLEWGVEDIDFGLKAWLTGHRILLDPRAVIGHRFRQTFDSYSVSSLSVPVNQLRMARKNFSDAVWAEWLDLFRSRQKAKEWKSIWALYSKGSRTVERERKHLAGFRVRDEIAYARRFGLEWPGKNKQ